MFKKLSEKFKKVSISTKIIVYFFTLFYVIAFLLYITVPIILNYPPDTINTQFDKEVSVLYYKYQFLLAVFAISILFCTYLKISLRKIDRWWKNKKYDQKTIYSIRKLALSFTYKLYLFIQFCPTISVLTVLTLTGNHPPILLFKMGAIIFIFSTLTSSLLLIVSKNVFYPLLVETSAYIDDSIPEKRGLSLKSKLLFQLFPSVLLIALILSLIGYYRLTTEKGELLNSYYKGALQSEIHEIEKNPTIDFVNSKLSTHYVDTMAFSFIEKPDGTILTSNDSTLGHFFVKYMHDLSPSHNNTVYDSYTIDSQAVIEHFTYLGETYTVGIYFEISSFSSFLLFMIISIILFIFSLIIIIYVIYSLLKDINNISQGLRHIINNDTENSFHLPITSDDEIGDLVMELNTVQDLNKERVTQIRDSQDKLMEKERLASLGQLIGGIAHNLKTPIMSISGAAEGISDLIKEYNASIEDPQVNAQDHHDIAKDMNTWVNKIKEYTEYMSDVITAVKGQAVTLSDEQSVSFTVEELVKRIDILMKHELKEALINLIVSVKVDPDLSLNGNVNSLVQVINNMISNSIQAYHGEADKNIDFIITSESNLLILTIKDYAGGLPKEVKEKLFKEMITTKGKNGTGLGLFMSYSNIRAHFNGNISFESKDGKGTSFHISIPLPLKNI